MQILWDGVRNKSICFHGISYSFFKTYSSCICDNFMFTLIYFKIGVFFLQIWHSMETFQKILKSSGHINTIWNRLTGKFQIIWKYQDSFETIRKVLKSSGNILTALKLWRKFWNYPEMSRQFSNRLKSLRSSWNSFETVWKIWSHQEMSTQFCYMFSLVSMSRMLKLSNSQTEK